MTRIRKPSGRHPFGSGRKEISYRRHRGSRSPERVILILCEGSKTEPQYFRHFKAANRLRTVQIEVIPGGEDLMFGREDCSSVGECWAPQKARRTGLVGLPQSLDRGRSTGTRDLGTVSCLSSCPWNVISTG